MPLITKIDDDLKNALKSGDNLKVSVLRLIKTSLTNLEKQAGTSPTDDDALTAINREIKQRQDTITQLQASRPDMVEDDKKAIEILKVYVPTQMSEQDVAAVVAQAITDTGATSPQDMGKVMGAVMAKIKGKADGQLVSTLVREKLQS